MCVSFEESFAKTFQIYTNEKWQKPINLAFSHKFEADFGIVFGKVLYTKT